MANPFYQPGEQRAEQVKNLFATVAPRYDLINDLQSFGLHRRWKRRLVRLADPRPGERALDVCCGTGDIAFSLANAKVRATGLDFSEPMLEVARKRSQTTPVEFFQGDAQALPFPDESFDIITVGYGLRNLADWRRGLAEMHRVARPGGRLLVLDFGKPDNRLWRACYFGYLRFAVPVFGKLFCGSADAYSYILESLRHYPAQHGVAAQMRELGCEAVRICPLLGGAMSINYGKKRISRDQPLVRRWTLCSAA